MGRVVVAVDQIVKHARMPRVPRQKLLEHPARAHVEPDVAPIVSEPQQRQRVEGSGVDVLRMRPEQRLHAR
jgi:hypothetical protein